MTPEQERRKKYNRDYTTRWKARDPEGYANAKRAALRADYAKHREARNAKAREYYARHKRGKVLERKYGVDAARYDAMLAAQGGRCAICRSDTPGGRFTCFHVDHCHKTGKVRGLLCNACNHVLGCARDQVEVLQAAAAYLRTTLEVI